MCCLIVFQKWGPIFPVTSVLAKNITVKVAKPMKNGHSRYILQGRLHVIFRVTGKIRIRFGKNETQIYF